ncbi:MAG: hypothetical protein ACI97A_002650 [Planctomycetota bacterium]|jgi:hypothetical protein
MRIILFATILLCVVGSTPAQSVGTEVSVISTADATLIGPYSIGATERSSGGGNRVYVGRTGSMSNGIDIRRALMRFNLTSLSIPPAAQILSVRLHLIGGSLPVTIRKLNQNWGEGTNPGTSGGNGGGGAGDPAQTGDATWNYSSYPTTQWTNLFGGSISAMSQTSSSGINQIWSTPQMLADVEGWLNNPGTNFGWLLHADELNIGPSTITTFQSRESTNPTNWPRLTITYTIRPGSDEDFALSGGVNGTINYDSVISAAPGDALSLHLESPLGGYDFTPHFLCGQIYVNGFPPFRTPFYPEIYLDFTPGIPVPVVYVYSSFAPLAGPTSLPPGGQTFNFTVPPGLAGMSSLVQGYSATPSTNAMNPWFTATHATRIKFL